VDGCQEGAQLTATDDPAAGVLRTPDECFDGIVDFPYPPRYMTVHAEGAPPVRMHYVDAGDPQGSPVLLLHGQPTWSYLYRHVIAVLVERGLRCIAPDNIGFGRSDKPREPATYTYRRHVDWATAFMDALDLHGVTLVVQDWGGPIGLGALAARPHRVAGAVASNTVLHTCDPALAGELTWANHATDDGRMVVEQALLEYVAFCARARELVPSMFVGGALGSLDDATRAAYDAPFPEARYTAGVRQMTALIPLTPNDPGARTGRATTEALTRWSGALLTAFSDGDPATRGWERVLQRTAPGAAGRHHRTIEGAGHFVQEERGEELAGIVAGFVEEIR
jgi:haloalkane dehalogenase